MLNSVLTLLFFGGGLGVEKRRIILKSLQNKIYIKESGSFWIILLYHKTYVVKVKQEGLCKKCQYFLTRIYIPLVYFVFSVAKLLILFYLICFYTWQTPKKNPGTHFFWPRSTNIWHDKFVVSINMPVVVHFVFSNWIWGQWFRQNHKVFFS